MLVERIDFNVAGVTFKNEKNIDIQDGVKKIFNKFKKDGEIEKSDLYGGYTNKEIEEMDISVFEYENESLGGKIELDSYNNEPCFKVYISTDYYRSSGPHNKQENDENYFHIGYIPKEYINKVLKYFKDENITKYYFIIRILGGKYKELEYDDEEDKEKVVIKDELTYGFRCELAFHDEKINPNTKTNKDKNIEINKENSETKSIMIIIIVMIIITLMFIGGLWSIISWLFE